MLCLGLVINVFLPNKIDDQNSVQFNKTSIIKLVNQFNCCKFTRKSAYCLNCFNELFAVAQSKVA